MLLNINGNNYLCNCFEVWRGLITYFGTEGSVYVFSMFYGGFVGFTVWMKVKRPSYVM